MKLRQESYGLLLHSLLQFAPTFRENNITIVQAESIDYQVDRADYSDAEVWLKTFKPIILEKQSPMDLLKRLEHLDTIIHSTVEEAGVIRAKLGEYFTQIWGDPQHPEITLAMVEWYLGNEEINIMEFQPLPNYIDELPVQEWGVGLMSKGPKGESDELYNLVKAFHERVNNDMKAWGEVQHGWTFIQGINESTTDVLEVLELRTAWFASYENVILDNRNNVNKETY